MNKLSPVEMVAHDILNCSRKDHFAGYDPFDGLNSLFLNLIPAAKKGIFGLAWIQLFKRSPINIRPLFLVPKKRNPKGVGLFILGLLQDYERTQDQQYLNEAIQLGDWLLTQQSDKAEWKHACWGYHFDWNARAFFVSKGKPNAITTVYVSKALYELGKYSQDDRYTDAALDSASFIVETLLTTVDSQTFFAYIPGETAFVHNASLWAAAWVAFAGHERGNASYVELALDAARLSVNEQADDGSWVYGARHHHQFIDGFHTGYNLETLDFIRKTLSITEFDKAISKGLAYYKKELIETDGTARYYNHNRYPLDMHSVTQAILTLLKVSDNKEDILLVEKIIQCSIDTLYIPDDKQFIYQKNRHFSNKINYIRWTQAWAYYSFAYYNRQIEETMNNGTN